MRRTYNALLLIMAVNWNPHLYVNAQSTDTVKQQRYQSTIKVSRTSTESQYKADNTIQNMRDRDVLNNPTAQDQSNRRSDIKLTAKLRRAVIAEHGLSTDAKNIKIIDSHGVVILRGPVDSYHEKQILDKLAQECCGPNYKNELELKIGK